MPPPTTKLHQDDTHRLIPAKYAERAASVLTRIADSDRHLKELFELEGATNDRLLGESNLLPGITVHELVFGTPYYHIVNAAFTHARPHGSRFNGPERGAWYAGYELLTAQTEAAFHFGQELREIPAWKDTETRAYREYMADFRAEFHDLRGRKAYSRYLNPNSYTASQQVARSLLDNGSAGIVYSSVRHYGGTCIACFRPALVTNVREGRLISITFADRSKPPRFEIAEKL